MEKKDYLGGGWLGDTEISKSEEEQGRISRMVKRYTVKNVRWRKRKKHEEEGTIRNRMIRRYIEISKSDKQNK